MKATALVTITDAMEILFVATIIVQVLVIILLMIAVNVIAMVRDIQVIVIQMETVIASQDIMAFLTVKVYIK